LVVVVDGGGGGKERGGRWLDSRENFRSKGKIKCR